MSEVPDIRTSKSDMYREINVSGQISRLDYSGLDLTVWHDVPDLTDTLSSETFRASKVIIDRQIECTIHLDPQRLKEWAITLAEQLRKYEQAFGVVLSPEEVAQKFREFE